jgi:hypothetical protein
MRSYLSSLNHRLNLIVTLGRFLTHNGRHIPVPSGWRVIEGSYPQNPKIGRPKPDQMADARPPAGWSDFYFQENFKYSGLDD